MFERLFLATRTDHISSWSDEAKRYKYTHRPRVINDTPIARKDISWFIQRYDLEVSNGDRKRLTLGARRYDKQQSLSKDAYYKHKPIELDLQYPLREYQEKACSLILHRKSLLVADQVGLGKTPIGIAVGGKKPPALCIVPPHLISQWEYEIKKFLPKASVFKFKSGNHKEIPPADFYVISYFLIGKYIETFTKEHRIRTVILDEVHNIRRHESLKYSATAAVADKAAYKIGLSATPIMNYGSELFNIYQILEPGALGERNSFYREWCDWGKIKKPEQLGNFLRKHMMMVRRTRKEVCRELKAVERLIYNVDADMETLNKFQEEAKVLALKVITGDFKESGQAARDLDWKLRQATGVAKARSVAEMVKAILESGEKVVLFGWHRDVYDIWLKELRKYKPVMYTGSETPRQKEDSLKEFIEGDSKVFIMSLRSGAGVNGLQDVCSYAVFGELDWSPGVIDQCIGRIWREGQENQVTAMFITIDDGADPHMKKVIGMKATETKQIMNPEADILKVAGNSERILDMAKDYLKKQGTDVDKILADKETESRGELFIEPPSPGEQIYELWNHLTRAVLNPNTEAEMQEQVEKVLRDNEFKYDREYQLSKRSRVDFKVENVLIECKAKGFSKRSLLRQIKRYMADYPQAEAVIIVTPDKIRHFSLKGLPVYAINVSDNSLLIGGLS